MTNAREEITLARLRTVPAADGGSAQQYQYFPDSEPRLASWRQLAPIRGYRGDAEAPDISSRFVFPIMPERDDDPAVSALDTGWIVLWRSAVYRVETVRRNPITLMCEIDCSLLRREVGAEPVAVSIEGLLNGA